MTHANGHGHIDPAMVRRHYLLLGANLLISAVIMYLVMFTMIWGVDDFFNNINMFYMALMMVSPMATLMLLMMGMMYPNRKLNMVLHAGFALVFTLSFIGMRDQTLVGDRQFLRSMIPHHSGAILMCREASVSDPEIQALCREIVRSQLTEIGQMKRIMKRL